MLRRRARKRLTAPSNLAIVVGTLLVVYPGAGAEAITMVLAFYFIAGGLFKTFGSIVLQFPSWGWTVASGVVSVAS